MDDDNFFKQYQGVARTIVKYWKLYGGIGSFCESPYMHFALVISMITVRFWQSLENPWYDVVISVIPSMLGFTFAGFAILLTFGSDIRRVLCGSDTDGKPSPFINDSTSIVHFLVVQTISLLLALIFKPFSVKSAVVTFVGIAVFYYAISLALAAILAMFRMATYIDQINPDE